MKIKVGDKVRVLPGWKPQMDGSPGYSSMEKLGGKIFIVRETNKTYGGIEYFKLEGNSWKWTVEMVEFFNSNKKKPKLPKL